MKKKQLENMSSSKFEKFKEFELLNAFKVLGGTEFATSTKTYCDIWNDQSSDRTKDTTIVATT